MKKNTTKRALVASILMLCLCFSALIGTTFAWFTDSVTSSGNVIQTGKFDVGMYWAEGTADPADKTAWKDASLGAIFNNEYWEPGYSEAKHLKIVNEGTLALKYELAIIPHGEFSKLAEVIEVYYVVGATEMKTRNDLDAHYIGTLNDLVNNGIESGSLLKGESYDATIVLKMKEEAGNEYQNLSIGTEFSIQLVATQLTSEKDSFDNQYDANAFEVVNDIAQLQAAINNAEDTKTIFIKSGDYTLNSIIVVEGKSVTLVGLGSVNIKMASANHMFTIQDSKNPNSEMNVTIKNINLDGNNVSKNGFNVKYNVTLNLENVNVKNTTWADVLLDNANKYTDGKFYDGTKTVVNLKNSNVEDVSMDTLPVVDTHAYADAGVTTYAEFNYDKDSTVGVVEKQTISKNYATMFINGSNTDTEHYVFTAANDEQLSNVLATIQGNSKYWNTPVVVKLAAGEYDGDYVVNQYPEWNGERGHGNKNNPYNYGVTGAPVLNLTIKGEVAQTYGRAATAVPAAIFTGTFTVNGFGNSMTGFSTTKENPAPITFKTVAFKGNYDGSATFVGNSIVFKALNAVDNLYFDGCYFVDATHVTLGSTTPDNMGSVEFTNCTFEEGGCLSGRFNNLVVKDCIINGATKGFINQQKSDATGAITIDNLKANVGAYLVRTNGGVNINVSNSDITVTESEGTNAIVVSRGNGDTVNFVDCTRLDAGSIISGTGASNSDVKEFYDDEGVTYYDDIIKGTSVLYLVPSDYEKDTVEVAEGVDAIGNYAFSDNSNVKTVILSSTVRDLGRGFDTSSVEKVVLNEGLEVISSRAFRETKSLKEVVIPSTVTEIADNAFQKTGLKTVVIPASVKTIGETAFGASLIETVIFEGDIDIQGYAFRGCPNLREVYMKGNNVNFVPSTLNGRNSTWFCNSESNNNNVSEIDFYVENAVVAARVWKAMGVDDDKVSVTVAHPNDATTAHVNTTEDLVKAITDKVANINVYEGTYELYFTNNTAFNVDGLTINGIGKVYINVDSSEVHSGRIQGDNVIFNNIDFSGTSKVWTTGKATYNYCTFNRVDASSGKADAYINNCVVNGDVHTEENMDAGNVYVTNSQIAKAEYNASENASLFSFTDCTIGELIIWGNAGTTELNNCTIDVDKINKMNAGTTLKVNGKVTTYVSNDAELATALTGFKDETNYIVLLEGIYTDNYVFTSPAKGDVYFVAAEDAEVTFTGKIQLGLYERGTFNVDGFRANVTFEGITFQQATEKEDSISVQNLGRRKDKAALYNGAALTLKDCTIINNGEYGVRGVSGAIAFDSLIIGCKFINAALQPVGNFGTGLVVDDCDFINSYLNAQGGDSVTVKNCDFENTVTTEGHNNGGFYAIRSNSTPFTVTNCTFHVNSTVVGTGVANANGWAVFVNRGTTNWTVTDCKITMTDAALAQPALQVAFCKSTGKINMTNVTVNGGEFVATLSDINEAIAAGESDINLAGGVLDLGGAAGSYVMPTGDLTIKDGTIKGTGWTGELNYAFNLKEGNIVFENVTFDTTNWSTVGWAQWGISVNVNGTANVTFKNCTFKGSQCPIYQSGSASVITLENCIFEASCGAIQCENYSGDYQLGQDLIVKNCDFTGVVDVLHIYNSVNKEPTGDAIAQYLKDNGNIFTGTCKQTCK